MAVAHIVFEALGCNTTDHCDFTVKACTAAGECKSDRFTTVWGASKTAPDVRAAAASSFGLYVCVVISLIMVGLVLRAIAKAVDNLARSLEPHAERRGRPWPFYRAWTLRVAVWGAVVCIICCTPLVLIEEAAGPYVRACVAAVLPVLTGISNLVRHVVVGVFRVFRNTLYRFYCRVRYVYEIAVSILVLCAALALECCVEVATTFFRISYDSFPEDTCIFCRLFTLALWVGTSGHLAPFMSAFVRAVFALLAYLSPCLDRFLDAVLEYTNRRAIMTLMVMSVLRGVEFYWDLFIAMSEGLHDDLADDARGDDEELEDEPDDGQEDGLWRLLFNGLGYFFRGQQQNGPDHGQGNPQNVQDNERDNDQGNGQHDGHDNAQNGGQEVGVDDDWVEVPLRPAIELLALLRPLP